MLTLGIETSCDETAVAVVAGGRRVRSSVVSSQIALHAPFGGVVPEIASRRHVQAIVAVTEQALAEANITLSEVDAIAVTYGPGLAGALLVGVNFASGLALARGLTPLGVNHLEGHLHSVWLADTFPGSEPPPFPLVALIVSGGHTQLVHMLDHGRYRSIGSTRDDAAGEAFDKVARLLGLPYPGGPAVSRAAMEATAPVSLPRAWLPGTYDFSFSGLKTAVVHLAFSLIPGNDAQATRGRPLPRLDVATRLSVDQVANIAAGFEESVVDVLSTKTVQAAEEFKARAIAVVGGVAANRRLRARMEASSPVPLYLSSPAYSTDNAAMIAAAGYWNPRPLLAADVRPSLPLTLDAALHAGQE